MKTYTVTFTTINDSVNTEVEYGIFETNVIAKNHDDALDKALLSFNDFNKANEAAYGIYDMDIEERKNNEQNENCCRLGTEPTGHYM